MKRRLTIGIALPVSVGLIAIGGVMHSPASHTFAAGGTPPPPPTFIPTTIPGPPGPPTATPTITPTPLPTATSVPTATVAPTDTPQPAAATPTPKPNTTNTPTPAPTATTPAGPGPTKVVPVVKPVVVPTVPPTGGGGSYLYSSHNAGKLSHTTLSTLGNSTSAAPQLSTNSGVTALPRTGGGSGDNPTSPLAPLALLAALAIGAGRFLPRLFKR